MSSDSNLISSKELAERARRRRRAARRSEDDAREKERKAARQKTDERARDKDPGVLDPEEEAPGAAFRRAQRNVKYAYAEAAERCLRQAAAMTAGRQDDVRARSVEEALEALNHDASMTVKDMGQFADEYMSDAIEKAMGG